MQRNRDRDRGLGEPGDWDNEHVGVPPKVCPTKVPATCCNTWPGPPQLARVTLAKATSCPGWMKAQLGVTGVSPLARSRLRPFSARHSVSINNRVSGTGAGTAKTASAHVRTLRSVYCGARVTMGPCAF